MNINSTTGPIAWGVRLAGGAAALMGGFWLAAWLGGWAAHWPVPGGIIPKTNMALCQLLGGLTLLLVGGPAPNRPRRAAAAALAIIMLLIGALTLGEHLTNHDFGIDQLIAAEAPGAAATTSPNRMGPLGSACLALLGAGLLALASGRRRLAPPFGLAVCLIDLVPAIGFLYDVKAFFNLPRLTGIALPTVVTLLTLGGGLVLSQRESGPLALLLRDDAGSRLFRRMLPVVVFVPVLIGWLHVNLERGGLYDRNTSDGVLVLAMMVLLSAMVWRAAVRLSLSSAAEVEAHRAMDASEEELRSSQKAYRHLVEGSRSVILRSDGDLNITYINSYGLAFFGYAAEELIGRNALGTIIPEADGSGRDLATMAGDLRRHPDRYPTNVHQNRRKDGSLVWMSWANRPIYDDRGNLIEILAIGNDLTVLKEAEAAARESEERFRSVLDNSIDVIYRLNLQTGRFEYISPSAEKVVGFSPAELLAQSGEAALAMIHPDDLPAMRAAQARLEETGEAEAEYRQRVKGGDYRWISNHMSLARDADGRPLYRHGNMRDITDRKKTEALRQALAEQERLRLGAAVEQASDSIVMVDLDCRIQYVNAAFESLRRAPRNQIVGLPYFAFLAGETGGAIREAVVRGRPWRGPLGASIPGGSTVELDVTISAATDPSGKLIGGLITERDVTKENALERQVRQAQKMEALGTLAGGITHDFNNILGTIIINTELALLDLDPANPARWPLPLVLQAANRGKELVKQIITFSRQRAWERKPLEIVPIVKEGTKFLSATLPKDITIRETIDAGSGVVLADPSHIQQILVNLCQNAALAMADKPGPIDLALAPVEVGAAFAARHPDLKPGPYVRLTVADSGCGMSPETMDRIFEPFFTTRKHSGGSGLGLAVVQGIVKSYDGAITVSSEPGRGSVFDVYIPRLEGEALAAGSAALLQAAEGRERILLVEDEASQRTSLAHGLERLGYKITARADGHAALAAFKKTPSAFDIVITDQIMPRMSGLELAGEIAQARPDIPIILCTGFSEKVDGGTVGQRGIRELVMKPFTIQEITRAIRAALKK